VLFKRSSNNNNEERTTGEDDLIAIQSEGKELCALERDRLWLDRRAKAQLETRAFACY